MVQFEDLKIQYYKLSIIYLQEFIKVHIAIRSVTFLRPIIQGTAKSKTCQLSYQKM